jgi:gliding motility-associated-like protein
LVNLGPNRAVCDFEDVLLQNLSHQEGFHYAWQNGSSAQRINAKTPGIYSLDVSTYCGTVRDSILIVHKTEGCLRDIFVPTAFTPNSDGKNDVFKPIVHRMLTRYELNIYNRWGHRVFYTSDYRKGWDGTLNGLLQDSGVFVWTCSYQFEENRNIVVKKELLR